MRNIVKNTTRCGVFDLICPHRCRGCDEIGEILCECCKKDITLDILNHCPKCGRAIDYHCVECKMPFEMTFVVGYRDELIGELAKEYKYSGVRSLGKVLAEILDEFLPNMSGEVVVVPLPTIKKHVRERGVDHTYAVAKKIAKKRGYEFEKIVGRKKNTVQVGSDAIKRQKQAREAFEVVGEVDKNKTYILYDDFWTTGATMVEAAKLLRKKGAKKIVAVVLATNRKQGVKIIQ